MWKTAHGIDHALFLVHGNLTYWQVRDQSGDLGMPFARQSTRSGVVVQQVRALRKKTVSTQHIILLTITDRSTYLASWSHCPNQPRPSSSGWPR